MDYRDLSDPALRAACRYAVLEVLETMFYEVPLADEVLVPDHEPGALVAHAPFEGTLAGWHAVAITPAAAGPLAAEFLGLEVEETSEVEQGSILLEITNMVCGATLSRLVPHGRIQIGVPLRSDRPGSAEVPWLRFPLGCGFLETALWMISSADTNTRQLKLSRTANPPLAARSTSAAAWTGRALRIAAPGNRVPAALRALPPAC